MNIEQYLQKKSQVASNGKLRSLCTACLQPDFSCFCASVRPFDPGIKFVILSHPIEAYKRVATGRMAHMNLINSELIVGHDYSKNAKLNAILEDPSFFPVLLYPGNQSVNLSKMPSEAQLNWVPKQKRLTVLVVDGTWSTARKTVHLSQNMKRLPRICFTPPRESMFRVRKQPRPECVSTIEAIHQTIELLGASCGFRPEMGLHNQLLDIFDEMVERQIQLSEGRLTYRHRQI